MTSSSKRQARLTASIGLFFFLPLLSGVIGRWVKGKTVYSGLDFQSILCGGALAADGRSRYWLHGEFACEQYDAASSFIYLPWLADLGHGLVTTFGASPVLSVWACLSIASLAIAIYLSLVARLPFASRTSRLPFASLITGSVVYWGNIAGLIYALFALSTLFAARRPLLFVCLIVFAGAIKQTWLTGLVVILLLDLPVWKRWMYFLLGALAGLAPTLGFILLADAAEVAAWAMVTARTTMAHTPGQGLLGWLIFLGLPPQSDWIVPIWLVYASLLVSAGLGIVARYQPEGRARVWLGVLIMTLLIPRIVTYDFLLFAPGMALILGMAQSNGHKWFVRAVYGACILTALIGLMDSADAAIMLVTALSTMSLLITGLPHARAGILQLLLPKTETQAATTVSPDIPIRSRL